MTDEKKYVEIVFRPRAFEEKKLEDFGLDETLNEEIKSGTLTSDKLLHIDMTQLFRLAYKFPVVNKLLGESFGWNGVPLQEPWKLMDHQAEAMTFMRDRELHPHHGMKGGILLFKMGLGKTLTTLLYCLANRKRDKFPSLVVCSKTVITEWKSNCKKFFGDFVRTLVLTKDFLGKEIAEVTRQQILKADIVFTTYPTCQSVCKLGNYAESCFERGEEGIFTGKIMQINNRALAGVDNPNSKGPHVIYNTPWARVIFDESQTFANPATVLFKTVMAIYGHYRWCLSGTPIRNYDTDIWAQMRVLGYNSVQTAREWRKKGRTKFREENLSLVIMNKDYESAGVKLPDLEKLHKRIPMSEDERKVYSCVLKAARDTYSDHIRGLVNYSCVLAMFTRLRQCSIAPYLMTAASKREHKITDREKELMGQIASNDIIGQWINNAMGGAGIESSKMKEIVKTVGELKEGEKILIFSAFTSCLDLISLALDTKLPNVKYEQIDGDTKGEEREMVLEKFKKTDVSVLLLSYKVGSEGLNLTEATHCICVEPWWTHAVHNQAVGRAHRVGQKKKVTVHEIIVTETIEERVLGICQNKEAMADEFLSEGASKKKFASLDKATLARILGL